MIAFLPGLPSQPNALVPQLQLVANVAHCKFQLQFATCNIKSNGGNVLNRQKHMLNRFGRKMLYLTVHCYVDNRAVTVAIQMVTACSGSLQLSYGHCLLAVS